MYLKPGIPWEYCPRETLRRVSKVLKDEFNLVLFGLVLYLYLIVLHNYNLYVKLLIVQVVNAGFESEFFLLRKTTEYVFVDLHHFKSFRMNWGPISPCEFLQGWEREMGTIRCNSLLLH